MDAKNGQLMLVELHSEAGAPVSFMHLSVKVSKEGNTSPCLNHKYMAACVCINLKSD